MGTRAQFFIGNPENIHTREWLGFISMDGYPDADDIVPLANVKSEQEFRDFVRDLIRERRGGTGAFPFPWENDLFLTDVTYAWFPRYAPADEDTSLEGKVMMTRFSRGWIEMPLYLRSDEERQRYDDSTDILPNDIPAPGHEGTTT